MFKNILNFTRIKILFYSDDDAIFELFLSKHSRTILAPGLAGTKEFMKALLQSGSPLGGIETSKSPKTFSKQIR